MAGQITAGDIATLFNLGERVKAQQAAREDDAIRFQGAQEYDSLLKQGLPHEEALRKTAHKMFYNDPGGMTSALRLAPTPEPEAPKLMNVGGNLLRVGATGGVENLFTAPQDESLKTRSVEGGLVERDKEGNWRYVQPAGTPPAPAAKEATLANQVSLERLLNDSLKNLPNLTPGTDEYDRAVEQITRIEDRLGIKRQPKPKEAAPQVADADRTFLQKLFGQGNPLVRAGRSLATRSAGPAVPKVGEERKGYRFKGGNPADKANWEKIQ